MRVVSGLDPRVNAFRSDLADQELRSTVVAERYVRPILRQCARGIVPLLRAPDPDAPRVSEIRYGEFVDVFEERPDGFAWIQNRADRYVGYLPNASESLSEEVGPLERRISALHTLVYSEPNVTSPPRDSLTLGSYVRSGQAVQGFIALSSGGYVAASDVVPSEALLEPDYVLTAGRLLGVPYLWGGRTPLGIDCSGLLQLVLDLAGLEAPRDSDQQRALFGHPLEGAWSETIWQRGDLLFFKENHVGIMTDREHLLHANGFDKHVVVRPLAEVMERGLTLLAAGRPRALWEEEGNLQVP